jgi:hypothetical protein
VKGAKSKKDGKKTGEEECGWGGTMRERIIRLLVREVNDGGGVSDRVVLVGYLRVCLD